MANIQITVSGTNIDFDFGAYGDGDILPYQSRYQSGDIITVSRWSDYVEVIMRDGNVWDCCYTATGTYLIIDKISTVAPTSNTDLYTKLIALM